MDDPTGTDRPDIEDGDPFPFDIPDPGHWPVTVYVTQEMLEEGRAWARRRREASPDTSAHSLADLARIYAAGDAGWQFLFGTFLDWMRQPTLIDDADRQAALDAVPPLTGDPVKDAELAGMAEQLAADYGLAVPAWIEDSDRFLPEGSEYWMFDTPEGHAILRDRGLASFARHGVYVMPNHLTRM